MKKNEVNKFRQVLEARVIEFSNAARRREGLVIERSAEEMDRVLQACEREIAARSLEFGSAKRNEAVTALKRMDQGSYGICADCEETIAPARLAAVPWTSLCIRCQTAADRAMAA